MSGCGLSHSITQPIGAQLTTDPVTPSIREIKSVSALEAANSPRHRWYFFKEAFSPEVVQRAASDAGCCGEDLIVDPFCGGGTVPVQAAIDGYRSAALEVNPFLAFVARAKLGQCDPELFETLADEAARSATRERKSPLEGYSTFTKTVGAEKWLFNIPVLRAFEGANQAIRQRRGPAKQMVKLCLIGAAMDAANAAKDGKCLRYRADWKKQNFDDETFITALGRRARHVAQDLRVCPLEGQTAAVDTGDSRKRVPGAFDERHFKLCVTSPPYLNSFDYTDVYRPELFLGGWVKTASDLRAIRRRTLRSHVQVEWPDPTEDDFGARYAEIITNIRLVRHELWNMRIPLMIQAYFEDMRRVLTSLRGRARADASMWIVVSTSAYGGNEVPVDLIIADIACSCGWYLREVSVLRYLRRVPVQQWLQLSTRDRKWPQLRESIVVLDAQPRITTASS